LRFEDRYFLGQLGRAEDQPLAQSTMVKEQMTYRTFPPIFGYRITIPPLSLSA